MARRFILRLGPPSTEDTFYYSDRLVLVIDQVLHVPIDAPAPCAAHVDSRVGQHIATWTNITVIEVHRFLTRYPQIVYCHRQQFCRVRKARVGPPQGQNARHTILSPLLVIGYVLHLVARHHENTD